MENENLTIQKENEVAYQELLNRLRHLGYEPGAFAFGITWDDVAQVLSGILVERGQGVSLLSEENLDVCMRQVQEVLKNQKVLPWEGAAQIVIDDVLAPAVDPDCDDEGPLTEEYENWSRVEDGWLDAAFEERFELNDF